MAKITLLFLLITIYSVSSYKVLVLFPLQISSHYILGNAIAKGLANAGHDVTMMSPFEEKNPPKNGKYRDIILTGAKEAMMNLNIPIFTEVANMNYLKMEMELLRPISTLINSTLYHPKFQQLINSDEKFDVIILEYMLNDGLKVLACHFNAPIVLLSSLAPNFWVNHPAGNPSPPSYIADFFLGYSTKMTFWQRTVNSFVMLWKYFIQEFYYLPQQISYIRNHFPNCANVDDIFYNASLTFLNYHESISNPVPLVPSMIPIGGFHVAPPKELPNELQQYLDSATDGAIYFSLGSNMLSWMLNQQTKEIIVRVLGKRKEKVLWKWDEEEFAGKPNNIKIGKWFPQQDILAHPNVKLFISHAGLLSTIETVYHGVPVLALPVYADQLLNAVVNEENGYGLGIPINKITEEELTEKLNKLLDDPKYQENAKKRSALMHDRPIKPLDLAIYWTEFVARHKGAKHLRVAGLNLKWYQYFLLDVIAVVSIVIFSAITIVYYLSTRMWIKCRGIQKVKTN